MAGIGFALRELTRRSDYLGVAQAYGHAGLVTSGPWIFTIVALAAINASVVATIGNTALLTFRTVLIYNFCFSICLAAPFATVATRLISDMIYSRNLAGAPGLFIGTLATVLAIGGLLAVPFFSLVADLNPAVTLAAIVNFELLTAIWVVAVFLSALKDYTPITVAFASGMAIAVFAVLAFGDRGAVSGLLWGFNVGLAVIVFTLVGRILAEYPHEARRFDRIFPGMKRFASLALIGLTYNLASWVDKWIMWFAPEARSMAGLPFYHHYDGAMFYAYLTMIPAVAMFMVTIETRFFEVYRTFYDDIRDHAPLARIQRNHRDLIEALAARLRNMLVIQFAIVAVAILLAPQIVEHLSMDYRQLGMFRFGILGACFHSMIIMATVLLGYFDLREDNLRLQLFFLASNAALTLLTLWLGFAYYGYGYFLSTVVSAFLGFYLVYSRIQNLPYVAFIANNPAVR